MAEDREGPGPTGCCAGCTYHEVSWEQGPGPNGVTAYHECGHWLARERFALPLHRGIGYSHLTPQWCPFLLHTVRRPGVDAPVIDG